MSTDAAAAAELAATTNWRLYDGPIAIENQWHVILPVVLLALSLVLPGALCYFCLSRSRIVPYTPPNHGYGGNFGRS